MRCCVRLGDADAGIALTGVIVGSGVAAGTAAEGVGTRATRQGVVAVVALKLVVARAARKRVVAAAAVEVVVACVACNRVVTRPLFAPDDLLSGIPPTARDAT